MTSFTYNAGRHLPPDYSKFQRKLKQNNTYKQTYALDVTESPSVDTECSQNNEDRQNQKQCSVHLTERNNQYRRILGMLRSATRSGSGSGERRLGRHWRWQSSRIRSEPDPKAEGRVWIRIMQRRGNAAGEEYARTGR